MKRSVLFCSSLILGACSPLYTGGGEPLAQMTFDHVKTYPVYVASYEPVAFVTAAGNILPAGFVSDPAEIVYDYLKNRFEASGSQGKLRAVIENVTVRHEKIRSTNEIGAALGVANMDHYAVHVVIVLQAFGTANYHHQRVTLTAHRNIFISEYSSLVEREQAQMLALDKLVDDLDISIRKVLNDTFNVL